MKPIFRIEYEGRDVSARLMDRLLEIKIKDSAGVKSDECEIDLDDRDMACPVPAAGGTLRVWLGYAGDGGDDALVEMGSYIVEGVRGKAPPHTLTVKAKAADMNAATSSLKEPQVRSWEGVTLADIAKEIGGKNGLEVEVDPKVGGTPIGHEDQTAEADMHFLTRLVERCGGTFSIKDGKLIIAAKGGGTSAGGKPLPRFTFRPGDVASYEFDATQRESFGKFAARYHDLKTGNTMTIEVPGTAGNTSTFVLPESASDEDGARAAAGEAKSKAKKKGEGTSITLARGWPDCGAECWITLEGFRPELDKTWRVKSASHEWGSKAGSTKLELDDGTDGADDDTSGDGTAGDGNED